MLHTIDYLRLLNRKERFHLLCEALGKETFRLDECFRARLQSCLSDSPPGAVSIPSNAFVAMDFHLDWIGMALRLAADGPKLPYPDQFPLDGIANDGLVSGTQQDVDLLVAFPDGATTHLVMIEAKGDTHWRNEQLDRKAERLDRIFSGERPWKKSITPHFLLMSRTPPTSLTKEGWPPWMRPNGEPLWLPLPLPGDLVKVTRYAIVNAFDRCGLNEEWVGKHLFRIACLAIEGWPRVLWRGTDFSQLKTMLKACTKASRKAYREAGEEFPIRVEYPFSGAGRPRSDRESWLRFNELFARDDVVCGILGMEHPWRHWIVFRDNGKSLTMFDSSVGDGRWRVAKKKIHAGRRNRKEYRVNREELVLFRKIRSS